MRYCPRCGTTTDATVCAKDGTPTVRRVEQSRQGLQPGDVIGGRYRVSGELGRGGFGVVFEGEHVTTGHPVAIKILTLQGNSDAEEQSRRFFHEASSTSRLSHPNTVRVFDFGQTDTGELFLAMERLNGETLQALLSRTLTQGQSLSEQQAVDIGVAVLRSLGEAHANGLVHRDMKPANIFLHRIPGGEDIVKVLDFGIVKDVDAGMTQAGKALGTPTHMSPEQAMGRPVDGRADLYALAVVLWECLTGSLPYEADNPLAIVMKHVTEPVPQLSQRAPGLVRPPLAAVIERALAKEPGDRWQNAAEMRNALLQAIGAHAETGMFRVPASGFAQSGLVASVAAEPEPTPVITQPHIAPGPIPGKVDEGAATRALDMPALLREVQARGKAAALAHDTEAYSLGDDGSILQIGEEPDPVIAYRSPRQGAERNRVTIEPAKPVPLAPNKPLESFTIASQSEPTSLPVRGAAPGVDWLGLASGLSRGGPRGVFDLLPMAGRRGQPQADQLFADLQSLTMGLGERAMASRRVAPVWSSQLLTEDGQRAVMASQEGAIHLAMLPSLGDEPVLLEDCEQRVTIGDHQQAVLALACGGNGRLVASGSADGVVRLWDAANCSLLSELDVDSPVHSLAISQDAKLLVVGCGNGAAHLLEIPDLTLRRTLNGHRDGVRAVAVAGSRRIVVTGGEDGVVRTWDPVGGGARQTLRGHEGAIGALAVSHNGATVVSGGWDGQLRVWLTRTGEKSLSVHAHTDVVAGLALDRSGSHVATASDDRSAKVWRVYSGECIAERSDFAVGVKSVAFVEEQLAIVAGSWDGSVRKVRW